eukprot:CAMPEP_0184495672 /NCGR_PEP_ID=MMETSP0113_2-20130426/32008_1 /TAXON_ID=91329 /ORGANISM="Norrisiella sphaerica, Strain BC52" /LENGTH=363 /DNA_ID=CAMNT_0026881961 /DNA_START=125 /DNA_END=1216 /DNA_ORIENTATION=+
MWILHRCWLATCLGLLITFEIADARWLKDPIKSAIELEPKTKLALPKLMNFTHQLVSEDSVTKPSYNESDSSQLNGVGRTLESFQQTNITKRKARQHAASVLLFEMNSGLKQSNENQESPTSLSKEAVEKEGQRAVAVPPKQAAPLNETIKRSSEAFPSREVGEEDQSSIQKGNTYDQSDAAERLDEYVNARSDSMDTLIKETERTDSAVPDLHREEVGWATENSAERKDGNEEPNPPATQTLAIIFGSVLLILGAAEVAVLCNAKGFSCSKWFNVVRGPSTPWETEVRNAQFHAEVACVAAGLGTEKEEQKQEEIDEDPPQQILLDDNLQGKSFVTKEMKDVSSEGTHHEAIMEDLSGNICM